MLDHPALECAPVATAMLHARAAAGGRLDAFGGQGHGLQRRIEGTDVAGRRVLVVAVAVVVERGTGAAENVAEARIEYRFALDVTDLGL